MLKNKIKKKTKNNPIKICQNSPDKSEAFLISQTVLYENALKTKNILLMLSNMYILYCI